MKTGPKVNTFKVKNEAGKTIAWIARVRYKDPSGKVREVRRRAATKNEAELALQPVLEQIEDTGAAFVHQKDRTFARLADICRKSIFGPAIFREDGTKEMGLRSPQTAHYLLQHLERFFGERLVVEITVDDLRAYTKWRLSQTYGKKVVRKVRTTKRDLGILRRALKYAKHKLEWGNADLFEKAKSSEGSVFISDPERDYIPSAAEIQRLLDACDGERAIEYTRRNRITKKPEKRTFKTKVHQPLLKAIITLAIETGMRRGEILALEYRDIDFERGTITLRAETTKSLKSRTLPIKAATVELLGKNRHASKPTDRVFPIGSIKRSFNTAKRLAGLPELHFHDLRAYAITSWSRVGIDLATAAKFAGHSDPETTLKFYHRVSDDLIDDARRKMELLNSMD